MAKIGARNRVEIAMWAYETRRVGDGAPRRKY
jgi:DNA-binding CsgD family transcriptional regulator